MFVSRVLRSAGGDAFKMAEPVRNMGALGKYLTNQPNHVDEVRRLFQASPEPTYRKKESDKFVLAFTWGLFGVTALVWVNGAKDIMFGTNRKTLE